jgi:hypothetical protein
MAVSNILAGIHSLASGKLIQLKEKGIFSGVADQLNRTSDLLKKRKVAQENWIMGMAANDIEHKQHGFGLLKPGFGYFT